MFIDESSSQMFLVVKPTCRVYGLPARCGEPDADVVGTGPKTSHFGQDSIATFWTRSAVQSQAVARAPDWFLGAASFGQAIKARCTVPLLSLISSQIPGYEGHCARRAPTPETSLPFIDRVSLRRCVRIGGPQLSDDPSYHPRRECRGSAPSRRSIPGRPNPGKRRS